MDQFLNSRKNYYLLLVFLLLLTLLPILFYINTCSIRIWDEGRQAVNATYMFLNKNYLVTYFENKPDLWNTKPPFLIWLQVFFMQFFGPSEVAIRLPSAFAALLTVFMLFRFGWNVLKKPLIAVLSGLMLISSRGFMGQHVTLTGDYDALLILFITVYSLFFFQYLETSQRKYWWLVTLALICGTLTKGVAALIPLPGLIVYAILTRSFLPLLRRKEIYAGVVSYLIIVAGYYVLREQVNPGYWQAIQDNELGGRFLDTLEKHHRSWYYYLTGERFMPWMILIIPTLIIVYRQPESILRRFSLFAACYFFAFLIIISSAQTKLRWYDAPLFPIGSLLAAIGVYFIFEWLIKRFRVKRPQRFVIIISALLCLIPYFSLLTTLAKKPEKDKYDLLAADAYLLKDFHRQFPAIKNYTFLSEESYNSSLDYYLLRYRREGYTISDRRDDNPRKEHTQTRNLQPGEVVLTCSPSMKATLLADYEVEKLQDQYNCLAVRIIRQK